MQTHILAASDLHIGAPYALPTWEEAKTAIDDIKHRLREQIAADPTGEHYLAMGGDWFEFMHLPYNKQFRDSLELQQRCMEYLIDDPEFAQVKFRMTMGNHDEFRVVGEFLDRFKEGRPNFDWNKSYYKIGKVLLMHGDVAIDYDNADLPEDVRATKGGRLERGRLLEEGELNMAGPKRWAHTVANNMVVNLVSGRLFPLERSCQRICDAIAKHPELSDVTDVVFGHIHNPDAPFNHMHGGLHFHVTGASVRGMVNNMVRLDLDEEGNVVGRHQVGVDEQRERSGTMLERNLKRWTVDTARTIGAMYLS